LKKHRTNVARAENRPRNGVTTRDLDRLEKKVLRSFNVQRCEWGDSCGCRCQERNHLRDDSFFRANIRNWMCCHVKQKEIALFHSQDTLVNKSLREAFSDLFKLKADLHNFPRFTCNRG
jgi:hypothetical protein